MKKLLVLSLIFISCQLLSQELMSEIKFTQYLQEKVSDSDEKLKILVFDELILGSKFNNASFIHSLKDEYSKYKLKPEILKSIVKQVNFRIDSIYSPDSNYKIDTTKVVPILKSKEFINKIVTNDEGELVYDEFNKDLIIVYVEDKEKGYQGYRFFSINELNRIGYNKKNLYNLSLRNLKTILPNYSDYILDQEHLRYYRASGGDEHGRKYLSSLILFPDFLNEEKKRLKQNVIIGLPQTNQMIVVSKKNRIGLGKLRVYASSNYYVKTEHLLTKKLFIWDGAELKRYKK